MYTFIIDPSNNNKYNINSKEAKRLLKKYINVIYGGENKEELKKKKKKKNNSDQVCNKCIKISNNDYYCIGCESGATQNHWHDPLPNNISGEMLEKWWMEQAKENTKDALYHLEQ